MGRSAEPASGLLGMSELDQTWLRGLLRAGFFLSPLKTKVVKSPGMEQKQSTW